MKSVRFGKTECLVEKHLYGNGRIALVLKHDGKTFGEATINMPHIPLGPNHVVINERPERESMLQALVDGGIITSTNAKAGRYPIGELQGLYRERQQEGAIGGDEKSGFHSSRNTPAHGGELISPSGNTNVQRPEHARVDFGKAWGERVAERREQAQQERQTARESQKEEATQQQGREAGRDH